MAGCAVKRKISVTVRKLVSGVLQACMTYWGTVLITELLFDNVLKLAGVKLAVSINVTLIL